MMLVIGKQVISPVKYTEREKRELKTVITMLRSKALRQTFKHIQISVYTHANDSVLVSYYCGHHKLLTQRHTQNER
jgi:hypothetical protein